MIAGGRLGSRIARIVSVFRGIYHILMNMSQGTPTVSIGLPVYNGQKYLEECLRNLLEQTYRDFEIVISDNGSRDGTRALCERFAAADGRIRYFREEENRGASWNYNRVLELARGRYFRWAAYDDLISPEYLDVCVRSLDAHPADILSYGITVVIDDDGKEKDRYADPIRITDPSPSVRFREYLYKVGLTNAIYGLMRVDTIRRTSRHEPYPGSDVVLLGELAILGPFREHPEIRFYRRLHAQASAPANPSLSQLVGWFNPKASGRLVLPEWERFLGFLSAIRRSPLPLIEKARCLWVLLRWKRHGTRDLLKEGLRAARFKLPAPAR